MYIKVSFGILEFDERERYNTDGSYDGGIDGFFILEEQKLIYLIQSKFRTNEDNFNNKEIELREILSMDTNRILEGEESDENGNSYNGKIKSMQRKISEIQDIGRYHYQIVLLANLHNFSSSKLSQLTGGYKTEIIDFERCYEKLVFPVISGTFFNATDVNIPIDLSNKNAGSKISYNVKTKICNCKITVLFIPAIEIAKIMSKYKNSILLFNPRSYLDLDGQAVNNSIKETIINSTTNEFALYNNGITILSDETYINEKIGQKNKAQLIIKNPQIINGGQTSYTLSKIYEEYKHNKPENVFRGKELLLKTITLLDKVEHNEKLQLIDEISNATNKQTPVINADRFANEILHQQIQRKIFNKYGLLYERKRGEFSDGLSNGYISKDSIIERNLFLRLFYSANGMINKGYQKKLFFKNTFPEIDLNNEVMFDKFYLGYQVYKRVFDRRKANQKRSKSQNAKIYAYLLMFFKYGIDIQNIENNFRILEIQWQIFIAQKRNESPVGRRVRVNKITGEKEIIFSEERYINSDVLEKDVHEFFNSIA